MLRAVVLALAAALALPALAAEPLPAPAVPAATVIESAALDAQPLDAAAIEQGAALELFGLNHAQTTALIFVLVAVTLVTLTASGDSQGVP